MHNMWNAGQVIVKYTKLPTVAWDIILGSSDLIANLPSIRLTRDIWVLFFFFEGDSSQDQTKWLCNQENN